MEIIDDCLERNNLISIQSVLMGDFFEWYYKNTIDYDDKKGIDIFQFIHMFYVNTHAGKQSDHITCLNPILEILQPTLLARIKANLITRKSSIIANDFHTDIQFQTQEASKIFTTSIFYVNTNNGYTEFEDGTKVESIENRLVSFPTDMKHRGTSCTDQNTRIVINFNYIK